MLLFTYYEFLSSKSLTVQPYNIIEIRNNYNYLIWIVNLPQICQYNQNDQY